MLPPLTDLRKLGSAEAGWMTAPHHTRHCERSEAIQILSAGGSLDCFAALAMTLEM